MRPVLVPETLLEFSSHDKDYLKNSLKQRRCLKCTLYIFFIITLLKLVLANSKLHKDEGHIFRNALRFIAVLFNFF
jgi:hypothetical protein